MNATVGSRLAERKDDRHKLMTRTGDNVVCWGLEKYCMTGILTSNLSKLAERLSNGESSPFCVPRRHNVGYRGLVLNDLDRAKSPDL